MIAEYSHSDHSGRDEPDRRNYHLGGPDMQTFSTHLDVIGKHDREVSAGQCTHSCSPASDMERQRNTFGFILWSRVVSTWTPVGMYVSGFLQVRGDGRRLASDTNQRQDEKRELAPNPGGPDGLFIGTSRPWVARGCQYHGANQSLRKQLRVFPVVGRVGIWRKPLHRWFNTVDSRACLACVQSTVSCLSPPPIPCLSSPPIS